MHWKGCEEVDDLEHMSSILHNIAAHAALLPDSEPSRAIAGEAQTGIELLDIKAASKAKETQWVRKEKA